VDRGTDPPALSWSSGTVNVELNALEGVIGRISRTRGWGTLRGIWRDGTSSG